MQISLENYKYCYIPEFHYVLLTLEPTIITAAIISHQLLADGYNYYNYLFVNLEAQPVTAHRDARITENVDKLFHTSNLDNMHVDLSLHRHVIKISIPTFPPDVKFPE